MTTYSNQMSPWQCSNSLGYTDCRACCRRDQANSQIVECSGHLLLGNRRRGIRGNRYHSHCGYHGHISRVSGMEALWYLSSVSSVWCVICYLLCYYGYYTDDPRCPWVTMVTGLLYSSVDIVLPWNYIMWSYTLIYTRDAVWCVNCQHPTASVYTLIHSLPVSNL